MPWKPRFLDQWLKRPPRPPCETRKEKSSHRVHGAYSYATVTRLEQYRRIRGSPTRLFPRSACRHKCFYTALLVLAAVSKLTNMAITNVELLKLGLRIRTSRKVSGRNQKDFSKRCGINRSYFGGVERGESNLTFFSLCQIC